MLLALLDGLSQNMDAIVDKGTEVIVKFLDGLSRNAPLIVDAAFNLIGSLVKALTDNIQRITEVGLQTLKGFIDGLMSAPGLLIQAGKDLEKRVLDAAKNFLGIHSPSKKFMEVGKYVIEGYVAGIDKNTDKARKATEQRDPDGICQTEHC